MIGVRADKERRWGGVWWLEDEGRRVVDDGVEVSSGWLLRNQEAGRASIVATGSSRAGEAVLLLTRRWASAFMRGATRDTSKYCDAEIVETQSGAEYGELRRVFTHSAMVRTELGT